MNQKIFVIDVDETILNIEPLFFLRRFKKNYKEYNGKLIKFPHTKKEFYVSLRPGAKEFLKKAKKHFRLVAFSVAEREITMHKLNILGIDEEFEKVYGKEDLTNKQKCLGTVSKDFNVPISEIVAVDDNPRLFDFQDRVIEIIPWFIGSENNPNELLVTLEQAKLK